MNTFLSQLIQRYKGWFATSFACVFVSILSYQQQARYISNDYMQNLIKSKEVARIKIIDNIFSLHEKYTAEITPSADFAKRHEQRFASVSSSNKDIHFIVSVGTSKKELEQWKKFIIDTNSISFSFEERYGWTEMLHKISVGILAIMLFIAFGWSLYPQR